MADVTFDPVTRIIQVTTAPDADGDVILDFRSDVYSDGKDAWLTTPDLQKLKFAVGTVGGDSITQIRDLGISYFLEEGWKIRPYAANHRLRIIGNAYSRDGSRITIDPDGPYTVEVEREVSNLIDGLDPLINLMLSILNLIEADEEMTNSTIRKLLRGTTEVLLLKNVLNSSIPAGVTISLKDP